MNDEERTYEAVRMVHIHHQRFMQLSYDITDKFRNATKYPYILRFNMEDDRRNVWRLLAILPSKAIKKKHIYQAMCYTTYYIPPKHKKNDTNSGYGLLMYDPLAMERFVQAKGEGVKMAAVMDIVPHAINRFTERCLKHEGKTGLDIHKKAEELILRWRHFDVFADLYGDKSSIKHQDDGLLPYDMIMREGGILRGQLVNTMLVRMFTYVGKDDLYENQQERHDEMIRERAEWKAKGLIK